MLIRLIAVLAVCWLSVFTGLAQDKPNDDLKRIQGTWVWDTAEKQSDARPEILLEQVIIAGNKLTFHYRLGDQRSTSACEFTLDAQAAPKKIDFIPLEGANKGKT